MSESVTVAVAERIFDQQGYKLVLTEEGPQEFGAGECPDPDAQVVVRDGEPSFLVRFTHDVGSDEEVPDDVGRALRSVADRLCDVHLDGREQPDDEDFVVEAYVGPLVYAGGMAIFLDTDGRSFSAPMIDTMVRIFIEELTPLGVKAELSAAPGHASDTAGVAWRTSDERAAVADERE